MPFVQTGEGKGRHAIAHRSPFALIHLVLIRQYGCTGVVPCAKAHRGLLVSGGYRLYGWWRGNHCRRYGFKVIGRAVDFKKIEVGRAGYIPRAPPPNAFDHPITVKRDPLVEGVGGAGIGVITVVLVIVFEQ